MLKPIFPDNVGILVGGGHFSIGLDSSPQAHDVSGPYFTLYAMVIGFACILGTTLALRAMMRKFALVYMLFLRAFRCRHCFKRYYAAAWS